MLLISGRTHSTRIVYLQSWRTCPSTRRRQMAFKNNRSFLGWLFDLQLPVLIEDSKINCVRMRGSDTWKCKNEYTKVTKPVDVVHYPVADFFVCWDGSKLNVSSRMEMAKRLWAIPTIFNQGMFDFVLVSHVGPSDSKKICALCSSPKTL